MFSSKRRCTGLSAAVLFALGATCAQGQTDVFTGPNLGLWSTPGNWSLGISPTTQNFDITINPVTPRIVVFDTVASINSLNMTTGNALVLNSGTLGIAGAPITNAGLIQLNTGTKITLTANSTLNGAGSVTLASGTSVTGNFRVTSDNKILGQGTISTFFTNSGLVAATGGTLALSTPIGILDAFVNTGTLRADGGVLTMSKFAFYTNTGGTIEAVNGSGVTVRGTVSGGNIRGLSGGVATLDGPTLSGVSLSGNIGLNTAPSAYPTIQNSTSSATLVQQIAFLQLSGFFNNLGTLSVGTSHNLTFTTSGSLTGGGTVNLSDSAIGGISGLADSLVSNNVINATGGSSFVNLPNFTSTGTVHVTASTLTISGVVTLGGTVLVENGGVLVVTSSTLANVNTPITLNNGSLLLQATTQNTGTITGAGSVTSTGVLVSDSVQTTRLGISGTQTIRSNQATASVVSTLAIDGTSNAWTAKLDVNNNKLVVLTTGGSAKATALATLANQINTGRNNGNWQGNGITSSTVAADSSHYGVGLFDNAFLGLATFGGSGVNGNSLLVTQALLGDTNLDGHVNSSDLGVISSNWHHRVTDWAEGDLNLDGCVDSLDVQLIVNHWDAGAAFPPLFHYTPGFGYTLNAAANTLAVPEPGTLMMMVLSGMGLVRRPVRRHRRVT